MRRKQESRTSYHPGLFLPVVLIFLFAATTPSLHAQLTASVTRVKEKVELRHPGGPFIPARVGSRVNTNTLISTGFRSSAILSLERSGLIEIKPLTRLTLIELSEREHTTTTNLKLDVGRVRAKVQTAEGLHHDFHLLTTNSVASVRGTDFEGDGEEWTCYEGKVVIIDLVGRETTLLEGQSTEVVDKKRPPLCPKIVFEEEAEISISTNPLMKGVSSCGNRMSTLFLGEGQSNNTPVTVTW